MESSSFVMENSSLFTLWSCNSQRVGLRGCSRRCHRHRRPCCSWHRGHTAGRMVDGRGCRSCTCKCLGSPGRRRCSLVASNMVSAINENLHFLLKNLHSIIDKTDRVCPCTCSGSPFARRSAPSASARPGTAALACGHRRRRSHRCPRQTRCRGRPAESRTCVYTQNRHF